MKVERKVKFTEAEKAAVYMIEQLLEELVECEQIVTVRHIENTSRVLSLDELCGIIQDLQSFANYPDWWEIVD